MMPFLGIGLIGIFLWVLWWVFIITVIVLFVRWVIRQSYHWKKSDKSPVEILKERYAKGEIDRKEYEEMKKELEK